MTYLLSRAASLPVFVRALDGRRGATLPLLALLAALSVTTKDQAYALFVLVPLPILFARLAREHRPRLLVAVHSRIPSRCRRLCVTRASMLATAAASLSRSPCPLT